MAKEKPQRASYIGNQIEQFEQQQQELTENLNFQKIELIERNRIQDLTFNGHTMHNRISYSKLVFLELVESIKEIAKNGGGICGTGLLNPIMLRRNGSRLEIIHGRNRLDALTYIATENIPCIICEDISDELARYMRTSENINRDNLNPYDETLSILEYIQISCGFTNLDAVKSFINKIKNFSSGKISTLSNEEILLNGNVSAVLKKIGKYDITTFANRLSILNLNDKLVQAIKDERIDYTRAKIINSKLKDEEKIVKIIDYVEKNRLSSKKLSEYIEEEFLESNKTKKNDEVFSFINDIKDVKKKISSLNDIEKQKFVNEKLLEIEKIYALIKEQIN